MIHKYGLLKYTTNNIGDEIQSIAARQFLPRVDSYVDRDEPNNFTSAEKIKLIMNGWFILYPENWPPSQAIEPLFISFHITPAAIERLTSSESIAYLKKYEPIGCRDYFTRDLLIRHGVDAYFSGCLTLTLKAKPTQRTEEILIVDVDREVREALPSDILAAASFVGHRHAESPAIVSKISKYLKHRIPATHRLIRDGFRAGPNVKDREKNAESNQEKFMVAQSILDRYAGAKLVITSRLHCALPCLAFGTPVIFVHKDLEDTRFGGLIENLMHYTVEQFQQVAGSIDWRGTFRNPTDIGAIQKGLVETCRKFIADTKSD